MIVRVGLGWAALVTAAAASAQDERPTGYPRSANERSAGAVTVSAVYTGEVRSVVAGGIRRSTRYLDNLDLQIAVDAERAIGWRGLRLFAYVIRNNGVAFSKDLAGDIQTVSNIETGVKATRLFEAWAEQAVGDRGSIRIGRYNINAEFDTTISGGLFLLSSHGVGPDLSQSGRNGPSVFPRTSLAMRGEWAPTDNLLLHAAVLDGVPDDPARPRATVIRLARGDGALLIGELDHLTRRTKIGLGMWRYTARFDPLEPGRAGRGNGGLYAFVERQLSGSAERGGAGLAGWIRVGHAAARYNPIGRYLGAGIVRNGTFRGRSGDQAGISVAVADLGRPYRMREATGRREVTLEVSYRVAVTGWFSVQPDLQIVLDPGGRADLSPAIIPVLRVKVGR